MLNGITRPSACVPPPKNPTVPQLEDLERHSPVAMQNRVRIKVHGPDANGKDVEKQDTGWLYGNIVNTFGLASLASIVGANTTATNSFANRLVSTMMIGTGTNAETSTDTSIVASTASVSIAGAGTFTNTNLGNRTVEYQATFASNNPAGTAVISEIGLLCNSTANSQLLARKTITGTAAVNKSNSDVINISYDIIFTSSSTGA